MEEKELANGRPALVVVKFATVTVVNVCFGRLIVLDEFTQPRVSII